MIEIWLSLVAIGGLTFATRLSFIYLLGRWEAPELLQRALRYVPPAVLTAIIIPEIAFHDGSPAITIENPRLLGGLIAILVAWKTKNILLTIASGMLGMLVIQGIIK